MEEHNGDHRRSNDWIEYRRLILSQLEEIGKDITTIYGKLERVRTEDLAQIKLDIALLKLQAMMWGALGGTVLSVATAFVMKMLLK